jgi:hypothetical protein
MFNDKGLFLNCDERCWLSLYGILLFFTIDIYREAYISGCYFAGRGFSCREFLKPQLTNNNEIPSNKLNILKTEWFNKEQYSSWCKFKYTTSFLSNTNKNKNVFFGHLNFFFDICIKDDKFFSKMRFASITTRIVDVDSKFYLNKVNCDDSISFESQICFIPTRIIVPTPILLVGFDKEAKPYSNHNSRRNGKDSLINFYSKNLKTEIETLVLIELNPSQSLTTSY